jgi:hypothetical protein
MGTDTTLQVEARSSLPMPVLLLWLASQPPLLLLVCEVLLPVWWPVGVLPQAWQ